MIDIVWVQAAPLTIPVILIVLLQFAIFAFGRDVVVALCSQTNANGGVAMLFFVQSSSVTTIAQLLLFLGPC